MAVLALGELVGDLVHDLEAPRPVDGVQFNGHHAVVVLEARLERVLERDQIVGADPAPVAYVASLRRSASSAQSVPKRADQGWLAGAESREPVELSHFPPLGT